MRSTTPLGTNVPTKTEVRLATESSRLLAKYARRDLKVQIGGNRGQAVTLPASAVRLLVRLLSEMAAGNTVELFPTNAELTTQQAADALGVSRPFLVKLLDSGDIPSRKVGTHRRVVLNDLLAFKARNEQRRIGALNELAAQAQELKMGY